MLESLLNKVAEPQVCNFIKKETPTHNPGQRVVNKFTKLSKIDFCIECFRADFLRVFNENVKIWL